MVCPGVGATDFEGGAGRAAPFDMSADGVVQVSLTGLRLGESICVPGLEDQAAALDALVAAETALMFAGNQPVCLAWIRPHRPVDISIKEVVTSAWLYSP